MNPHLKAKQKSDMPAKTDAPAKTDEPEEMPAKTDVTAKTDEPGEPAKTDVPAKTDEPEVRARGESKDVGYRYKRWSNIIFLATVL